MGGGVSACRISSSDRLKVALAGSVGFCLLLSVSADAAEVSEFYRGLRMMGMGGASVAIAEEDEGIFLNPASMAGNSRLKLRAGVLDLLASTTVVDSYLEGEFSEIQETLATDPLDVLDAVMGKRIYLSGSASPSLLLPYFGMSLYGDQKAGLSFENQALPQVNVTFMQTAGVQAAMGYGMKLARGRNPPEIRVGLGAKLLYRKGGTWSVPFADLFSLSQDTILAQAGEFSRAYGGDLGLQYIQPIGRHVTSQFGLSYQNLGGVNFDSDTAEDIPGNLAMGGAVTFGRTQGTITVAYDVRQINQEVDFRKRSHLGVEVKIPMLTFWGGINQTYLTYGGAVDFWLARAGFVVYKEEQGALSFKRPDNRWMLRLEIKL